MATPQNSDNKRFQSPLAAVQAWLAGDFEMGEEDALIAVIRQDPRIKISDDEIEEIIFTAMASDTDAFVVIEQLAAGA